MAAPDQHFRLETLADGVHAAVATPGGFALCNAAIVDLGGTTLVFDAMLTPEAGRALGKAAERLTGRPVGLLVNSHYHGDHIRGSAAVGAAHVVSTRRVRDLVIERGPVHLRSDRAEVPADLERLRSGELPAGELERRVYEGWFNGILATPADLSFAPPDLTFEGELTVHGSRRSARVISYGGGHSPSDVLVYLPEDRIAFLGDLLSVGYHPSLGDGEPFEFARIVDRARELPVDRALPGHGPVCDRGGLDEMAGYLRLMLDRAHDAVREGLVREQVPAAPAPEPYARWAFSAFYAENARFVFDRVRERSSPPAAPAASA